MTKPEREALMYTFQQKTYLPILSQEEASDTCALRRIMIATRTDPEQPCGYARRIGTNYHGDHALYRLRIRYGPQRSDALTLPDVFMLARGHFQPISPAGHA